MTQAVDHEKSLRLGNSNASKSQFPNAYHQHSTELANLQTILTQQRTRFQHIKANYEAQLNNEKRLRIELENKLIKLKDELARKEVIITELEFEQNSNLHQNQNIKIQNQKLKNQIQRLENLYSEKIFQLENRLSKQGKNFDDATNQYMLEFQKFKKQGQDYIEALNYQYQKKIKNLEQRVKAAESAKKELLSENKRLNQTIVSNQLQFDTELRETTIKVRNDDLKRSQMATKSFQQRLKNIQQNKQALLRRNQQLLKTIQQKQKTINNYEFQRHESIDKLQEEVESLRYQNAQLNTHYQKLKNQVKTQSRLVPTSDAAEDSLLLKQQLSEKKEELNNLKEALKSTKAQISNLRSASSQKQQELMQKIRLLESQVKRYKDEYTKICETLKIKINEAITVVSKNKS